MILDESLSLGLRGIICRHHNQSHREEGLSYNMIQDDCRKGALPREYLKFFLGTELDIVSYKTLSIDSRYQASDIQMEIMTGIIIRRLPCRYLHQQPC
jgi:hypothetical protein